MKNLMNFNFRVFAVMFVLFAVSSCQKEDIVGDNGGVQSNIKSIDLNTFQTNVENGLGTQWAGYSFVINQKGTGERFSTYGKRIAGNDGDVPQNIGAPMYAASINKTITAAATLRILKTIGNKDVASMLNANVFQFLPPNWTFGPNTTNIKFIDLLRHESGIPAGSPLDYASLRTLFAQGTSANKSYNYDNANYALLRIIIAMVEGSFTNTDMANDNFMSDATNAGFDRYMRINIFDKINISVETKPFGNNPALYYNFGNQNNGWDIGDLSNRLGNGGYYIAPVDIAKFLAHLNHTNDILDDVMRKEMYDNFLGWSDGSLPENEPDGEHGTYYYKGGSFCNNSANGTCNGQGVRNVIASFPQNEVEIVIMANSRGGAMDSGSALRSMLRNAFDNAFIFK